MKNKHLTPCVVLATIFVCASSKQVIITAKHCKDKADKTCEEYATWRFGAAESCPLMFSKEMFCYAMMHYDPPLACPFKKSVYNIRNATVDLNAMSKFNFPFDSYWRVTTDLYSVDKQLFCMLIERMFLRVRL